MRVALSLLVAGLLATASPVASADEQWAAHVPSVADRAAGAEDQSWSADVRYSVDPERKHWLPGRARQQPR